MFHKNMRKNQTNLYSRKSIFYLIKRRKSGYNNNLFLFNGMNKKNSLNSFTKNKKKELKLPHVENSFGNTKAKSSFSHSFYNSNYSVPKKGSIKFSNIFPTSINEKGFSNNRNSNIINNYKQTLTESNIENSKISKNDIFSEQSKSTKINEENIIKKNNNIHTKFKQYQHLMEMSSSLINQKGMNLSNEINNNPFMRKIEDLNKINHFEILFHDNIMKNIKDVYQKTKKGFFKIEHMTKSKDALGTGYLCENQNNIFSVSDMIERMNPISTLKFSNLLRKDYKEFLGYNKKRKKIKKEEDILRKKLIKRYHRELFFENELADKYNIKKNSGIKLIIEHDDDKQKNTDDNINETYY